MNLTLFQGITDNLTLVTAGAIQIPPRNKSKIWRKAEMFQNLPCIYLRLRRGHNQVSSVIRPIINTGIAHKDYGVGQVGAGLVNPPEDCFKKAIEACAGAWGQA